MKIISTTTLLLALCVPLGLAAQPAPTMLDTFKPTKLYRYEKEFEETYNATGTKVLSKSQFGYKEFNSKGQLILERDVFQDPQSPEHTPTTTYKYDASGHLVDLTKTRADGSVSYNEVTVWDETHQQAETKRRLFGTTLEKRVTEKYDAHGLLVERTYEGPKGENRLRNVLSYDAQQRPIAMLDITDEPDTPQVWTTTYPNDSTEIMQRAEIPYGSITTYTTIRNAHGQPLSLIIEGPRPTLRYTYRYDAEGWIIERWFYKSFEGPIRFTYVRGN